MTKKTLSVVLHMPVKEIADHYRECLNGKERSRWHLIFLLTSFPDKYSASSASNIIGYSKMWGTATVRSWNTSGAEGLRDGHEDAPGGRPALLSSDEQQELKTLLETNRPPDGGLWTGPKICKWIQQKTGKKVQAKGTGWNYLIRCGFSLRVLRPKHTNACTPGEADIWKKKALISSTNHDTRVST